MSIIHLRKSNGFKNLSREKIVRYYNITGISCDNEYVPLYAPFVNKGVFNKQIAYYSLPTEINYSGNSAIVSYSALYSNIDWSTRTAPFQTKSMEFKLLVIKGALFEKISDTKADLLFTVAVKEDYMSQMFKDAVLDKSKFVMLVSSRFTYDSKFKTIYRKVYNELIKPHLEEGIDLIITNNIVGKCFQNHAELPKFKSFTDLRDYLHAFNLEI